MNSATKDPTGFGPGTGAADRASPADEPLGSESQPSPFDAVQANLAELAAYVGHYLSARRDLAIHQARSLLLKLVLAAGVGLLALSAAIYAVGLVLLGVAGGLAAALGDRPWAGGLITGGLVLIILAASISFGIQWLAGQWHKQVITKYEQYRRRQRAAFGHNAPRASERHP